MKPNDMATLEAAFRAALIKALSAIGEDAPVLRGYDKQKKGQREKAVYFHMLNPSPLAPPTRRHDVDKEEQLYAQAFSVDCYMTMVDKRDALMLAHRVLAAVQTLDFIYEMRKEGVAPLKPTNIRTIYTSNQHNNFEAECSITMPLTFKYQIAPHVGTVDAASADTMGV